MTRQQSFSDDATFMGERPPAAQHQPGFSNHPVALATCAAVSKGRARHGLEQAYSKLLENVVALDEPPMP